MTDTSSSHYHLNHISKPKRTVTDTALQLLIIWSAHGSTIAIVLATASQMSRYATQHIAKAKPRAFLTDRRIHFHSPDRYNDYMDLFVLNTDMSDLIGDPNQVWTSEYWTCTELVQPAPLISQDLYPLMPTLQLDSNLLQHRQPSLPSVPVWQYNTQDYTQLPGTYSRQSQWNMASWDQFNQNATLSIQQNQPSLHYNAYRGAAHTAPQPSKTDAMSNYLSPERKSQWTPTQSYYTTATSDTSLAFDLAVSDMSRSVSPDPKTLMAYGYRNTDNSWSCAWPGCTSCTRFTRACDLRKHYKRHSKTLFCRYDGCPQSTKAGFSSNKDRARHEAKHNPMIICEWESCRRLFSRVDNMVRSRFLRRLAST